VGRTVPSFRMALEEEIASWSAYRRSLGPAAREALDAMFNGARTYCSASSNAVRPVKFEGMFMALAFDHERRLESLAVRIEKLEPEMRELDNQGES
jgi:hypothetical protein